MTNGGSERLDRTERIVEDTARNLEQFREEAATSRREMAARQQYHDEALERHDATMKRLDQIALVNAESIRVLTPIAKDHNIRLNGLDGGESA